MLKSMQSIMKKSEVGLLVLIASVGLFLRLFFLPSGALTFGFDQARDAFTAQNILKGDLKILGPPASTSGLFHGVLYFYLLTPAYFLGSGDPKVTAVFLAIINILTVIPIFLLGKILFSSRVGLVSAFLFAVSFDAVQYSLWMSNPAPAVLAGAIFYLGLTLYIFTPRKTIGVILTGLGLGLSIQFEIFLGYLVVPLIIVLNIFDIKPTVKQLTWFLGVSLLTVSSMLISYIKFGPTFLVGLPSLFSGSGDPFGSWRQFFPTLGIYLNRYAEYFYRGFLPFNVGFAGFIAFLVTVVSIYWTKEGEFKKQITFILILIFSHGLLIPFGGENTPFINAGLQAPIAILIGFFLVNLYQKYKLAITLLFLLIVFSCLSAIFKYNPQGQTVFAIQRGLTLKNELAAIDYTYQSSNGKPFSINTITSPLWINTVWAYLYNWHGLKNYGSLPSFHGRDQTGYLGSLPQVSEKDQVYFLIIEPLAGIPATFAENTETYENSFSKVSEEKDFGGITVQKRLLTKPFTKIEFIK